MNVVAHDTKEARLRAKILALCREYQESKQQAPFVPGETYIPPSGKVVDADDLHNLVDASLDMWLTAGRYCEAFEGALAAKFGTKHSRLTVSGSAANLLAFTALTSYKLRDKRLKPGDEVITVAAGFPTTIAPIFQNGCVPVFVDADLATANVDVDRLEAAIGPKTRAIVLAHTLGNPFNLGRVVELAKAHNLFLIEDCCDAFGATYNAKPVGTFGDLATLSFYPAHHITMGEGGAVMTNKLMLMKFVESFRDWGRACWCAPGVSDTCGKRFEWNLGDLPPGYDHKYIYTHLGYNMKATDMQGALGMSQLEKVDGFVAARRANYAKLTAAMKREGLDEFYVLPEATPGSDPSWFGYLLTIRDGARIARRSLVDTMEKRRVGTRLMFAGNLTKQPALKHAHQPFRVVGDLTVTDKIMNDSFWIGLWPGIDDQRIAYMIDTLKRTTHELVK